MNFKKLEPVGKNTCWAHALSILTGCSYDKALFLGRKLMLKKGMDYSSGMYFSDILALANELTGRELKSFQGRCGTLKGFIDKNPTGSFLVCSESHAMAVVDGTVFDFKKRMNFKIVEWILVK